MSLYAAGRGDHTGAVAAPSERVLSAVLFTDLVSSTMIAEELGDRRWKALVNQHHAAVRRELKRFGGRELDTAGDGFFASFREPASAISCACAAADAVRELGLGLRAGVHFGECERIGKKLGGITVVVGSRIMSLADAGEVLISSTAAELTRGGGFELDDRGQHQLKGVEGSWRVFAVTAVDGKPRPLPLGDDEARARREAVEVESGGRRRWPIAAAAAGVVLVAGAAVVVVTTRSAQAEPPANSVARIDPGTQAFAASHQLSAGVVPSVLAAEGSTLWVGDVSNNSLSGLDPDTGQQVQLLGTATGPTGLALAGGTLWVSFGFDSAPGHRLEVVLSPQSGLAQAPFEVPSDSYPVAANADTVWVANPPESVLVRYDTTTRATTHVALPTGSGPVDLDLAADGTVWVAAGRLPEVYKVSADGHGHVDRYRLGTNVPTALSVAPDGSVWVVSDSTDAVNHLSALGASRLHLDLGSACDGPGAVAALADRIWIACTVSQTVVALDPSDGSVMATLPVGGLPVALSRTSDGTVWVAVGTSGP
jgi:class 3 adenylate cyclase/streptogramin lyase